MKKLLNLCLLLCSLIGYLEWGTDQHAFLFQVEYEVLFHKAQQSSDNFSHPFILLPLIGQLLLLISLFQKTPGRWLSLGGLACLSLIMLFLLIIGILGANALIAASAIPFILTGIFVLRTHRRPARTS